MGVDIFFREAPAVWGEAYPFADERALGAARRFGLGGSAPELAAKVGRDDTARLVAGLVRVDLEKAYEKLAPETVSA